MVFFLATGQYHAPINGYMVMTDDSALKFVYPINGSRHDIIDFMCILP